MSQEIECVQQKPTEGPTEQTNLVEQVSSIITDTVNQPTDEDMKLEHLREIICETRIRTETVVPEQEYTLAVDETGIFAKRDIHAVKAKAKAGKTTTLKVFIAALILGVIFRLKSLITNPKIVFFDTEQNRSDTKKILDDVVKMTGLGSEVIDSQVILHSLRRVDQEELLPLIRLVIEEEHPDVVFIDGVVELVASFNDEAESKQLIKDLLVLCDENNCAIVCVLHTNKSDDDHQMRGHLGTMLAQKAGTVLECMKERGSRVITIKCTESRHEEPKEWSIMFDEEGRIVDADEQRRQLIEQRRANQQQKRQEKAEADKQERLNHCLRVLRDKGGVMSRKQLTEILTRVFDRKRTTVTDYISGWLKEKSIFEDSNGLIHASDELSLDL